VAIIRGNGIKCLKIGLSAAKQLGMSLIYAKEAYDEK